MVSYSKELALLKDLLIKSAQINKCSPRTPVTKSNNGNTYDVVTPCDISTEKRMIASLHREFPEDQFFCEETCHCKLTQKRTWVIDPIDGTVNFHRGLAQFGMQATLLINKKPVVSAIYLPETDEMITADSTGAYLNGTKIHVSEDKPIEQSIIALGDFTSVSKDLQKIQLKMYGVFYNKLGKIRMFGAPSYDFSMVATGRIDAHIRYANNIWDYLPGMHICSQAGAVHSERVLNQYNMILIAASEDILKSLENLLEPVLEYDVYGRTL